MTTQLLTSEIALALIISIVENNPIKIEINVEEFFCAWKRKARGNTKELLGIHRVVLGT